MLIYSYFALKTSYRAPIKFRQNCNDVFCRKMWQNIGRMEKPKSGTGARNANGNGNGTWTWARTRTKEIKLGDVSVLRVSLTIIARSRLFIPTLYLFIVIIFFTVAFFAYGAKFFFENFIYAWALQLGIMIDMSTPPPFAAFSSQWLKHGALLRNE